MKIKLQKVFIVCLTSLIVFSPALMVFGIIWQQHLELITTHEVNQSLNFNYNEQYSLDNDSSTAIIGLFTKPNIVTFLMCLLFGIPILLGTLLFVYERYLIHRATTHQENIDMLERLYQHHINK
jgi:ABC-type phosphate transport system permease subunit